MKFILGLIICSSGYQTCLEPYHWPDKFDDMYDCMQAGYTEAMNKMEEVGREDVNEYEIFIRFACSEEPEVNT